MKTILVGTDFTDLSEKALTMALELARGVGARVQLLHVVEPIGDPDEDPEAAAFHTELEEKARGRLSEILARVKDVAADGSVVLGHRSTALLQEAERQDVYLTVLGLRVPREDAHPVPGISHRVSWNSPRPVLLVP
ncbi:MAG: universal stress protein [Armatimonadetes bacterium]|nr:universal stress protein [Armatimonadota bacterium]